MALYVVCSYEDIYGGLHGIRHDSIIEANSIQEAYYYGKDEAWNVVYDYCYDEYEMALEDEEIDMDAIIEESLCVDVYEITKETNESLEILNEKLYNDIEGFIKTYCL